MEKEGCRTTHTYACVSIHMYVCTSLSLSLSRRVCRYTENVNVHSLHVCIRVFVHVRTGLELEWFGAHSTQSFQKLSITVHALNHIGILITI